MEKINPVDETIDLKLFFADGRPGAGLIVKDLIKTNDLARDVKLEPSENSQGTTVNVSISGRHEKIITMFQGWDLDYYPLGDNISPNLKEQLIQKSFKPKVRLNNRVAENNSN